MSDHPVSEKYLLELGRLVHAFANVEGWAQLLLWEMSDIEPKLGIALFSGVRAQEACNLVRRVFEAKEEEMDKDLEDTLTQVGHINTFRNSLIHFGAILAEDGKTTVISNWRVAHTPSRLREVRVSDEILSEVTQDLELIINRLRYFTVASFRGEIEHPKSRFPDYWKPKPWRYKPPQPVRDQAKTQKKPPKRQRRQKPSPG